MDKMTHLAVGIGVAAAIMISRNSLSTYQIVTGTLAAGIASTFPDSDLIDNRSGNSAAMVIETLKNSEAPLLYYAWCVSRLNRYTVDWKLVAIKAFVWITLAVITVISPHRGYSHSFIYMIACTGVWYWLTGSAFLSKWFILGYLSHILLDLTNKTGERIFFPLGRPVCFGLCKSDGIINNLCMVAGTVLYLVAILHA